jgi:hypothetical protein
MRRRITRIIDQDTGVVIEEFYRLNGRLHRDSAEGPAHTERDESSGAVSTERYYRLGRRHRTDGPALISYGLFGLVMEEIYYRNGLVHRDPRVGPAYIKRNGEGKVVTTEAYFVNDELYRDPAEGPYEIGRSETGEIEFENFLDAEQARPRRRVRQQSPGQPKKPSP